MTEFLNISLSNNASINNDIRAVCQDIIEHYKKLIPNGPPLGQKPLHVIHNPSTPRTFVNGLPHYYTIGLTTNERLYDQIAYQFAHELSHIYCDPRITNWFIESICEMASLYFIEYLSVKWASNPPFPNWTNYSLKYKEYKEKRIREVENNLNITNADEFENIFQTILKTIDKPYERNSNTVIALKLLAIFKENSASWKLLPLIGQSTDKILSNGSFFENSIPNFDKLVKSSTNNEKEIAKSIKKLMKKRCIIRHHKTLRRK